MTNILRFFLVIIFIYSCTDIEEKDPLYNLQKISEEEQIDQTITLHASIPSYTEDGYKIENKKWGEYIANEQYNRDLYKDSTGTIKAIVFKKKKPNQQKGAKLDTSINGIINKPAIDFVAMDINGKRVSLSGLIGKVVVLNFWFTTCKPCIAEMPNLNELKNKYENDVVFLGITFSTQKEVDVFLKKIPFQYDIIPDAKEVCSKWDINAFPTNVIIDRQGIVTFVNVGYDKNVGWLLDQGIKSIP